MILQKHYGRYQTLISNVLYVYMELQFSDLVWVTHTYLEGQLVQHCIGK